MLANTPARGTPTTEKITLEKLFHMARVEDSCARSSWVLPATLIMEMLAT